MATNCIVARNWRDIDGVIALDHSLVGDTNTGGGNLTGDPGFEHGYFLNIQSSCKGAGSSTAASLGLAAYTTRTDGAPYGQVATIDLGYHHIPGTIFDTSHAELYVAETGDDNTNTGTSLAAPFRTVTRALTAARDGTRIHIAPGIYTVASGETFPLTAARTDLHLIGGGAPGATVLDASGAGTRVTTLERAHNAALRNLTLTGGNVNDSGGGLLIKASQNVTIDNCIVHDNSSNEKLLAVLAGGGIYAIDSGVRVDDSIVTSNTCWNTYNNSKAYAVGGGIGFHGALWLRSSAIYGNTVQRSGLELTHVLGAGLYAFDAPGVSSYGVMDVRNALVTGNIAITTTGAGPGNNGGVHAALAKTTLENVTMADNYGTTGLVMPSGSCSVMNSIFWNNGTEINNAAVGVSYSDIASGTYTDGGGNKSADPLFINAVGGNYRLRRDSACVDTGLVQLWMMKDTDLDGKPRIRLRGVDMGCYETPPFMGTRMLVR